MLLQERFFVEGPSVLLLWVICQRKHCRSPPADQGSILSWLLVLELSSFVHRGAHTAPIAWAVCLQKSPFSRGVTSIAVLGCCYHQLHGRPCQQRLHHFR